MDGVAKGNDARTEFDVVGARCRPLLVQRLRRPAEVASPHVLGALRTRRNDRLHLTFLLFRQATSGSVVTVNQLRGLTMNTCAKSTL